MRIHWLLVCALALGCSTARSSRSTGLSVAPLPAEAVHPPVSSPASSPGSSPGAESGPTTWVGAEVRGYPAGSILALQVETQLSEHGVLAFGVGANLTDRQDWGEHDQEDGDGFGGGVGYRHYFGEDLDRWFLGGRLELWSLAIDWRDSPATTGSTDVLVLMPTVEAGYSFRLAQRWRLNLFAAGGAEINVSTDGEDVGEGAIGLLGISCLYGF